MGVRVCLLLLTVARPALSCLYSIGYRRLGQWQRRATKCACTPMRRDAYNELASKFLSMAAISGLEQFSTLDEGQRC